jgi:hypothetical protein
MFIAIALVGLYGLPAQAAEPTPEPKTFAVEWNARARHESVDDEAFAHAADAQTLRLRLGLRVNPGNGWSALVEGEGITALGDQYNSGDNRETTYPAIIDPEGAELNQAWVSWRNTEFGGTLGRQRILLDNQRWVGSVGWRQNEQTFDAVALDWKPAPAWTLRYDWLDRVHRINGDDAIDLRARERALSTHIVDASFAQATQQWGGYLIAHDDRDVATASTLTIGARWTGSRVVDGTGLGWRVEAANQREHADNPLNFSHSYWIAEPTWTQAGLTWRAGWEHLGGNGSHALQTPLATLHAFNGWADKFLVTPVGGLEDRYVGAGGAFGTGEVASKVKWNLSFHDYRADQGDDYGSEWDASIGFPVHGKVSGLVKVADYKSDGFARDTTKLWLQLEWVM